MEDQTASHDIVSRKASARSRHFIPIVKAIAPEMASTNSSAFEAMRAKPSSPYGRTTSRTGVETTGNPAERNSGVFVGLIKRVESFIANGMMATSQPAKYAGRSR